MDFTARVSKMGHKRMINVPANMPSYEPGTLVKVSSLAGVGRNKEGKE